MRVLSPLTSIDNYIPLIEAGADEFFCGITPYNWLKKYTNFLSINRREYLFNANICEMSSLKVLSRMVEEYKVPIKIAFNSHYYLEEQYEELCEVLKGLMDIGFNTFILADPAFIMYCREKGLKCNIHLSGETAEVNSESIKFFNELNIQRYIFHRKNSIEDMVSCINSTKGLNLEYEAFILNELCSYTGAFCNSIHCDELQNMCNIPYKLTSMHAENNKFKEVERGIRIRNRMASRTINAKARTSDQFGQTGCGICKLPILDKIGITDLKVVGRGKNLDMLLRDIKYMKELVLLIEQGLSDEEYKKVAKEKYFNGECSKLCYYR